MTTKDGIFWLSDDQFQKALGQLRLQLNGVFEPFRKYGQDVYIIGAVDEVIKLAEDFSLRCRGIDKPLDLENIRRKNR